MRDYLNTWRKAETCLRSVLTPDVQHMQDLRTLLCSPSRDAVEQEIVQDLCSPLWMV